MYAEEKLKIAMIELMETMPFEKITVTKLCQISHVSRPTFYHHYSSLANLAFESVNYQTKGEIPHLDTWEDFLFNIKPILNNMYNHQYLFTNFAHFKVHEEAVQYLSRLIKTSIKRQEVLLNYHLLPVNESFITRQHAETYLALLGEYMASDMTMDPDVIAAQCQALLSDAVNTSLRGFMRLEQ